MVGSYIKLYVESHFCDIEKLPELMRMVLLDKNHCA